MKDFWIKPVMQSLPPPLPYTPCKDPERHKILLNYMWEYRGEVCLWCDPEHATAWGYIDEECLCQEEDYDQVALVRELRREEEQKREQHG